jgi:hypothetical protein
MNTIDANAVSSDAEDLAVADMGTALLPHYVYVLAEPNRGSAELKVFYVGMGQGARVAAHWGELKRRMNKDLEISGAKLKKLKEIADAGLEPLQLVVGRFETRDEAFAVEAVLINWVYGAGTLTNANRGHNPDLVRPHGITDKMAYLDYEKEASVRDGSFKNKKIAGLVEAHAYELIQDIGAAIRDAGFRVSEFDTPSLSPYDPGESNGYLGVLVRTGGLDVIVAFTKQKIPSMSVATTRETRERAAILEARGILTPPLNSVAFKLGRYRHFIPAKKYRGSRDDAAAIAWVLEEVRAVAHLPST